MEHNGSASMNSNSWRGNHHVEKKTKQQRNNLSLEAEVPILRRAIRLVHCLQKERGASTAFAAAEIEVEVETQHNSTIIYQSLMCARATTDAALALSPPHDIPVAETLVKLRSHILISSQTKKHTKNTKIGFHRVFVMFNTLISNILHAYIIRPIGELQAQLQQQAKMVTTTGCTDTITTGTSRDPNVHKLIPQPPERITYSHSSSDLQKITTPTDRATVISAGSSSDPNAYKMTSQRPPQPPEHLNYSQSSVEPENRPRTQSNYENFSQFHSENANDRLLQSRKVESHNAGNMPTGQMNPSALSSSLLLFETNNGNTRKAMSLLSLLLAFVRLKESTGIERAVLSSLMSLSSHPENEKDQEASAHYQQSKLISDLVLELENQNKIKRNLRSKTRQRFMTTTGSSDMTTTTTHKSSSVKALFSPVVRQTHEQQQQQQHGNNADLSTSKNNKDKDWSWLDEDHKSLLALVEQSIEIDPEMLSLQNMIRYDFDLVGLKNAMPIEEFWSLKTLYLDKLHSLELLMIQEFESCLVIAAGTHTYNKVITTRPVRTLDPSLPPPSPTSTIRRCLSRVSLPEDESFKGAIASSLPYEKSSFLSNVRDPSTLEEDLLGLDLVHNASNDVNSNLLSTIFGRPNLLESSSQQDMINKIQNMEPEQLKSYILDHLSSMKETQAHERKQVEPVKQYGVDMEDVEKTRDAPPTVAAKAASSNDWEISLYEMEFQKRIGRGSAGTTYLAKWSGQDVAVKVAAITEMGLDGWNNEVQSLQRLHHPNIIRLLGSIYNPSPLTYCLVLEYCDAGDLSAALKHRTPPNFFIRVASSVASGMAYLHGRNILHRDIKPANVLLHGQVLHGNFTVKVTDFGVATFIQGEEMGERTAETGTYRWMAPEVIRHESYSFKADVYSFALLVWQLLTREDPFSHLSQIEAAGLVALQHARPPFPKDIPKELVELISTCWSENPSDRWPFDKIVARLTQLETELVSNKSSVAESSRTFSSKQWLEHPFGHPVYRSSDTSSVTASVSSDEEKGGGGGNDRKKPISSKRNLLGRFSLKKSNH